MPIEMPSEFNSREDIKRGFAFITERIAELKAGGRQEDKDAIDGLQRAVTDVVAAQKALDEKLAAGLRTPSDAEMQNRVAGLALPFEVDPEFTHVTREQWNLVNYRPDELSFAASAERFHPGLGRMARAIERQKGDSFERLVTHFQHANDAVYLLDVILSGSASYLGRSESRFGRMKTLRAWKEYERLFEQLQRTGLSTGTSASGGAWLPSFFSSQVHELVQLALGVANLFPTLDMPGKTYQSPVMKADGKAYYIAEQLTGAVGTDGSGADVKIPESNIQTSNMVLTAWKLAARMWTTSEAVEDIVVPVIPRILSNLAKVIAQADDNVCLNADNSTNHIDYARNTTAPVGPQSTDYTNQLKVPTKGLRALSLLYGWNAATLGVPTGTAANPLDFGTNNTIPYLLTARARLGSLGRNAGDLPIIVNMVGFAALMGVLDKAAGNPALVTVDKYGPGAVVQQGEVAKLAGHPIIVHEYVPMYLDGTTGKQTEAGTKTCGVMPYPDAFIRGLRRGVTIARSSERHIEYDQQVFVATARRDFQPWFDKTTVAAALVLNNLG